MRRFFAACAAVIVLWATVSMLAQEPPAYFIAKLTITDQKTMGEYRAGLGAVFQQFGGEVVAADGDYGITRHSRRQSASTGDFILLDGR